MVWFSLNIQLVNTGAADGAHSSQMAKSKTGDQGGGPMKLVIVGAAAAVCGMAAFSPALSLAQEIEASPPPALRGESEETAEAPADPAAAAGAPGAETGAAPAADPAEAPQAGAAPAESVESAETPAAEEAAEAEEAQAVEAEGGDSEESEPGQAAAAPALSPEQALVEGRSAALAQAAVPGALTDPLIAKAADYVLFQQDLEAVSVRPIDEPIDLDAIMDTLASYNASTLSDAWLSYGAFIAAQNPVFVDKVREVAAYYGEAQLLQGMVNEPEYVMGFDGARDAAARVLRVMREDAARLTAMSGRFKQESYDLQTRGWSNLIANDRDERLGGLAAPQRITTPPQDLLARVAYGAPITSEESAQIAAQRRITFWNAVEYRPEPPALAATQTDSAEALGVMMTLAAMQALDATQERPDLVTQLLDQPGAKQCLDFALLHLRQCVAAAHFKYEDAFCIAEHQIQDAGECLGETVAAGWVRPRALATPAPAPAAAVTEASASAPAPDTGPATYPSLTPAAAPTDQAAVETPAPGAN